MPSQTAGMVCEPQRRAPQAKPARMGALLHRLLREPFTKNRENLSWFLHGQLLKFCYIIEGLPGMFTSISTNS